jgi:hypothetical protein
MNIKWAFISCIIDYKQAHDSSNRGQLIEIKKEFGIPRRIPVKMIVEKTNSKVKGNMSHSFEVVVLLWPGDALFAFIFNLFMEVVVS